jgi:hypothetical protein|tara:strand:+ start:5672 stop:6214 length:543 start_codon:yes stop_codon:yes gene_type:complete
MLACKLQGFFFMKFQSFVGTMEAMGTMPLYKQVAIWGFIFFGLAETFIIVGSIADHRMGSILFGALEATYQAKFQVNALYGAGFVALSMGAIYGLWGVAWAKLTPILFQPRSGSASLTLFPYRFAWVFSFPPFFIYVTAEHLAWRLIYDVLFKSGFLGIDPRTVDLWSGIGFFATGTRYW